MSEPKKILFIGLSCIGDVIMTTPVLQALHKVYPGATIDVVADPRSQELYQACPYVGRVYIKDKSRFLRGAPALLIELWKNYYDVVIDVRTDGLAYLVWAGQRYTKRQAIAYGPHAVEKTMGVIAGLHGHHPIPETTVWMKQRHHDFASGKLSGFTDKRRLLAICTGEPSKPAKNWTNEKWITFLNQNKNAFSGVVFVGGPNEHAATEIIKKQIELPFVDVVGSSLLETAAILQQVSLYIGPDSGLGHLASAVKTNTVSLFSSFTPEEYQPWGNNSASITGADHDARNIAVSEMEQTVARFLDTPAQRTKVL